MTTTNTSASERPILFSAPMVRAILGGTKTQTRRLVKPRYPCEIEERDDGSPWPWYPDYVTGGDGDGWVPCPYGQPGDRLWVRETFALESAVEGRDQPLPYCDGRPVKYAPVDDFDGNHPGWIQPHYRATDPAPDLCCDNDRCRQCRDHDMGPHWHPSIHMPRWACRIVLEVTGVRVERLQAISEADAAAEGANVDLLPRIKVPADSPMAAKPAVYAGARDVFASLWESLNGAGSWDSNPWVWVIEFKRLDTSARREEG